MSIEETLRTFFIYFNANPGRETFSISSGKPGEHITIQPKWSKRLLDVHRTTEGSKEHQTIGVVHFFTIGRALVHLKRGAITLQELVRSEEDLKIRFQIRRINAGFLRRNRMRAMTADQQALTQVGFIRWENKGKKMKMGKYSHLVDPAVLLLEIDKSLGSGQYLLLKRKGACTVFAGMLIVVKEKNRTRFVMFPKNASNKIGKMLLGPFLDKLYNAHFNPAPTTVDL